MSLTVNKVVRGFQALQQIVVLDKSGKLVLRPSVRIKLGLNLGTSKVVAIEFSEVQSKLAKEFGDVDPNNPANYNIKKDKVLDYTKAITEANNASIEFKFNTVTESELFEPTTVTDVDKDGKQTAVLKTNQIDIEVVEALIDAGILVT